MHFVCASSLSRNKHSSLYFQFSFTKRVWKQKEMNEIFRREKFLWQRSALIPFTHRALMLNHKHPHTISTSHTYLNLLYSSNLIFVSLVLLKLILTGKILYCFFFSSFLCVSCLFLFTFSTQTPNFITYTHTYLTIRVTYFRLTLFTQSLNV